MTKAKDMFNTLFQIEELTKDEFISIIWSNPVEDDFISAMCALMDFFPYDENLTKHNNDFKKVCPKCGITRSMTDNLYFCNNKRCSEAGIGKPISKS